MKLRLFSAWRNWSLRRRLLLTAGGLVFAGGLAALLLWLLIFRGSAPPPPSVSERIASLEASPAATVAAPSPGAVSVESEETSESSADTSISSAPSGVVSSQASSSASPPASSPTPVPPVVAAPPPPALPPEPTAPPPAPAVQPRPSVDGVWTVNPTIGDFADFSSSYAGYRVAEELANIGATEAVGRTPEVEGFLEIDGSTVLSADIEVALPSIVSDRPRRDGLVLRSLEADQFPSARFVLTGPLELGELPAEGEEVSILASGAFTVHGVTLPVLADLTAARTGEIIVVAGSFEIRFEDYGIRPPRVAIVLSVADTATVEWLLNFTRSN